MILRLSGITTSASWLGFHFPLLCFLIISILELGCRSTNMSELSSSNKLNNTNGGLIYIHCYEIVLNMNKKRE